MTNGNNEITRQICVIDPAWVRVDGWTYTTAWGRLLREAVDCGFVGLDAEWSSNSRPAANPSNPGNKLLSKNSRSEGPVAVVQLSTFSVTFVIKLCDVLSMAGNDVSGSFVPMGDTVTHSIIAENLRLLLADENVAKVGVGILGDRKKLQNDYPSFSVSFCVELETLARHLFPSNEDVLKLYSLKDFAAHFAHTTLDKDILVRCSDWGSRLGALSPLQVRYAARDAEASFDACAGMFAESQLVVAEERRNALLQAVVSAAAESQKRRMQKSGSDGHNAKWLKKKRGKPYYDSVVVYDANMQPVFVVERAKAQWYVCEKGFAKVTELTNVGEGGTPEAQKEIAAIQLNFVPNLPKYDDARIRVNFDYFLKPKKSCCVACGDTGYSVRFFVVPLMYTRYFPLVYVLHQSYDVLLLCRVCYTDAKKAYDKERRKLSSEYGVPQGYFKRDEIELFCEQLQQELSAGAIVDSSGEKNVVTAASGNAGGRISFAERARNLEIYIEINNHRNILIKIFEFAKELHTAYEAQTTADESHANTDPNTDPNTDANETNEATRSASNSEKHLQPSAMSEETRASFVNYIREHAPKYIFAQNESRQAELFAEDAASPASIRCILEEGESFRAVLTRFWLREHPEALGLLSRKARTGDCGADCELLELLQLPGCESDKEGNNFVDSPGFVVMQSVMRTYNGHPSKTSDNAIGEFIYRWRKAFVDNMQPKHLPDNWSADEGILL